MQDTEMTKDLALSKTEVLEPDRPPAGSPVCPRCRSAYQQDSIQPPEYKCSCGLQLAYPEFTPAGEVRGLLGWLSSPGAIVNQRYKVLQLLGRGGFGSTYLVEDMKLSNKRWALKEIPEPMYDEHESRILSKLNHPSVPTITDREIVDGMVYMVLEFGGNRTLDSVRRDAPDKRVALTQMAPWARQLCDVLSYMHAQTPPVIHRDLKPANVLLDEKDRVMLIDFGIAKEESNSEATHTLGRAVTHGFSPPEQAMGSGTDVRSDVYALGATIYYLLTAQRPPGARERIQGIEIPAPSSLAEGIPPAIDRALLQSLALNPNERQQTVEEFGRAFDYEAPTVTTYDDLGAAERTVMVGSATTSPSVATTTSPKSLRLGPGGEAVVVETSAGNATGSRRLGIVFAAAAVLAVVAFGGYLFLQSGTPESASPPIANVPDETPVVALTPPLGNASSTTTQGIYPPVAVPQPTTSAMDELLKRRQPSSEAPVKPARKVATKPPRIKPLAAAKIAPSPAPAKLKSAASAWQKANANTKFQE